MRNLLCKFILLFIILCTSTFIPISVDAATYQSDYLTFTENEDGTLTVTGYDRSKHESPYCLEVNNTYTINDQSYTVSYIDDSVFKGYTFYSIYIGQGVDIGNYSFSNVTVNCYKYNMMDPSQSVFIESSNIGNYAFQNAIFYCSSYFTMVKHIGDYAFESTSFSSHGTGLDNSFITIGIGAFKNAVNVGSVQSSNLQRIGSEAFYNTNISFIYIPDSLTYIGENAIPNLSTLGIEINPGVTDFTNLRLNTLTNVIFTVHDKSLGKQYAIDNELMYRLAGTTDIIYPKAKIGQIIGSSDYAIGRVTSDSTCTLIGGTLGGITDSIINIGNPVISYNTHEYQVTAIGKGALDCFSSVEEIFLGDQITKIESGTFTNSPNLKRVNLPSGIESIEENAFPNSANLTIVIPDTITDISNFHFDNLTNVIFCISENSPLAKTLSKMNLIYQYNYGGKIYYPQPKKGTTFNYKTLKYKVTGKSMVTFMKPTNKNTTKITIPSSVSYKGYTFKVTKVDAKACYKLKKLKTVTIGDNVTQVGDSAFAFCSKLTSITFSKNVKKLGKKVLYSDKKLKKIKFKGTKLQSIGKQTFRNVPKKVNIIVPTSNVKKYSKLIKKAK